MLQALAQSFCGKDKTDPPLNAPTGFRAGNGVASANLSEDVWKLRVAMRAEGTKLEERRVAAGKSLDAIIEYGEVQFLSKCPSVGIS